MNAQSFLTWLRAPLAARIVFYTGLVAFLVSITWFAFRQVAPMERAADFTVTQLDGSETRLSDYQGKVLILNFWASWCAPCKEEMPLLEAYYHTLDHDQVALLAINEGEDIQTARDFVNETNLSFPVAVDPNGDMVAPYSLVGLPVTLIIGPNGYIRYNHPGQLYQKHIDEEIVPLIKILAP